LTERHVWNGHLSRGLDARDDLRIDLVSSAAQLFYPQSLAEVAELRAVVRRIEVELIALARTQGFSWEEIGAALGISRQAAHSRYARAVGVRR